MEKLSVVLSTINDSIATNLTIAQIVHQLEFDDIDYEIIIVDNGSSEEEKINTQAMLRYNQDFPIKYYEYNIKGTIPPHAFGATKATGTYITMPDPHMTFSEHYFRVMLDTLKQLKDDNVEVVFSPFVVGSLYKKGWDVISGSLLINPNPFGKTNAIGEVCKYGDSIHPILSNTLSGFITTKEWLMNIGNMFPDAFEIAGGHTAESLLIGIPTWMFGKKCYAQPKALIVHPVYRQAHGAGRNTAMALSMATAAYILGGDDYLKDMPEIYGQYAEGALEQIPLLAKNARAYIEKSSVYTLSYLIEHWNEIKM